MLAETRTKKPAINITWCKGCGICIAFCSAQALSMTTTEKASLSHPENCTSCGICELRCPDLAIEFE